MLSPRCPFDLSVMHSALIERAIAPDVTYIFEPLMIHASPLRTAVVVTEPARSLPPFASVSASAPSASPFASGVSHTCFCASVPKL